MPGRRGCHITAPEPPVRVGADMQYAEIVFDVQNQVGRITLNRPQKRNPLSMRTVAELCHLLRQVRDDDSVRVVLLTGAGDTFCAGGDLSDMGRISPPQGDSDGGEQGSGFADLNLLLCRLGKPTVAMVRGAAMGGGLGLVAACDLALAAESALFGTPEINVGLWPMIISLPLLRCVGRRQALRLMLGGQKVGAAEALRIGLVSEVHPDDALEARTEELARRLASRSSAVMALGLESFNSAQDMDLEPALRYLERQLWAVLATEDATEGIRAFMEKRRPEFKGR